MISAAPDRGPDAVLRGAGLRVTAPRVAVLKALAARPHSTADEIAGQVRDALGSVSTQAVYDVLRACVAAELVRRIGAPGRSALYETRTGDNHHHLVCRDCGAVADVDCAIGEAPCLQPYDAGGFEVDEAEVLFWGRCSNCRAGPASRRESPRFEPKSGTFASARRHNKEVVR